MKSILVRWPNWVGDAVMASGVLRSIKSFNKDIYVAVLGRPGHRVLFEGYPYFDEWIGFDKSRHGGGLGPARLASDLKSRRFEAALILPNSFSSALGPFLASIPHRIGYRMSGRGWMLTDGIRPEMEGQRRKPEPMPIYYANLVKLLIGEVSDTRPELRVTADEASRADALLKDFGFDRGEPFAAVNPGAAFGPSKLWSGDAFAKVCYGLREELGVKTLVLCGPGEEALAREISEKAPEVTVDTSDRMVPLDLLKPVLQRASVMVTTDTGPRHIAVAVGCPVVVVMGPTDPRYTASHLERTRVLRVDVECGPCHKKLCPIDHKCMTQIEPMWAIQAAVELAGSPRENPPPACS